MTAIESQICMWQLEQQYRYQQVQECLEGNYKEDAIFWQELHALAYKLAAACRGDQD